MGMVRFSSLSNNRSIKMTIVPIILILFAIVYVSYKSLKSVIELFILAESFGDYVIASVLALTDVGMLVWIFYVIHGYIKGRY